MNAKFEFPNNIALQGFHPSLPHSYIVIMVTSSSLLSHLYPSFHGILECHFFLGYSFLPYKCDIIHSWFIVTVGRKHDGPSNKLTMLIKDAIPSSERYNLLNNFFFYPFVIHFDWEKVRIFQQPRYLASHCYGLQTINHTNGYLFSIFPKVSLKMFLSTVRILFLFLICIELDIFK